MVADENEDLGVPQRAETGRKGDLRRLVDDAVVEFAHTEDATVVG
jgi:hypothetical protein